MEMVTFVATWGFYGCALLIGLGSFLVIVGIMTFSRKLKGLFSPSVKEEGK